MYPRSLDSECLPGFLEADPLVGPLLAVLIALPLGGHSVMLVVGLAVLLHLVESNVLIPRIMDRVVSS